MAVASAWLAAAASGPGVCRGGVALESVSDPAFGACFTTWYREHSEVLIGLVLIDIAIVIVVARLAGALFRRWGQPAVVGEIVAGIVLGPSLLGLLPGTWFGLGERALLSDWLFPSYVRPFLGIIAQIGLVIFMFLVGLELDLRLVRGNRRAAAAISLVSVSVPFLLGMGLASVIYQANKEVGTDVVAYLPFALFLGIAMSITAFPVLARILTERRMQRTSVGAITLASAAVDDIVAWSLLALVLAVVHASAGSGDGSSVADLAVVVGLSIAFVVVVLGLVRPRLERLVPAYERAGRLTPNLLSVVLVGLLLCSYATSKIGIHAIFGAFVFGAAMPRVGAEALTREVLIRLEQLTVLLLLPLFFIVTGLQVDLTRLFEKPSLAVLFVVVLVVACAGKFVGATLAARAVGFGWRPAAAIGTLMNTRGLTELVILNVGRSVGVLNDDLFTVLVLMAVVTTIMTAPLLRLFYPDAEVRRDLHAADAAAAELPLPRPEGAVAVVVAVEAEYEPTDDLLIEVAASLAERPGDVHVVLVEVAQGPAPLEVGGALFDDLGAAGTAAGPAQVLADRCRAAGCEVSVRSTWSPDQHGALEAEVVAVGASALVVGLGSPRSSQDSAPAALDLRRLGGAGVPVLGVRAPIDASPDCVGVVLAGSEPSRAASDVALGLAVAGRHPIRLCGAVTPSVGASLQERISARGLAVRDRVQPFDHPAYVVTDLDYEPVSEVVQDGAVVVVLDPRPGPPDRAASEQAADDD